MSGSSTQCKHVLVVALLLGLPAALSAQSSPERQKWTASWIAHPTAPLREPEVFHFRKRFVLPVPPSHFLVHVSADNRFLLFVNGKRVGDGPARGNLYHWRYETFDLARFLQAGDNTIAATVWQFGVNAPLAQITERTAFLVEGDTPAEAVINTDTTWEVEAEEGHTIHKPMPEGMWQYFVAGPGESIDASRYDWSWNDAAGKGGKWVNAGRAFREIIYPQASIPEPSATGRGLNWNLFPDPLPPMEYREVPPAKVVRSNPPLTGGFPQKPAVIPPNTDATILLDQAVVLSGYPELTVSGGKGSKIKIAYTEALYDDKQQRGNRNEVGNRMVVGLTDEFFPDGGSGRSFLPLWWRTWRYLELTIHTGDAPLQLETLRTYYSAYPFEDRGSFSSSDPQLAKIREICWRTARVDAHETYMDTAYWEQLQYIGDTRIQALISFAVSGDDRLARQALQAFDDSRIPEGLTQSRYPSSLRQIIPTFSLLYVDMLHDYWMYRPDPQFVAQLLPGTREVLGWFLRRQRSDGFLEELPYWTFVDTPRDRDPFPPVDPQGRSAILTLQFIGALQDAAAMEEALGDPIVAQGYRKRAEAAAKAVYTRCWNARKGLLADTPEQTSYSQHANLLAVLHDVIPAADQPAVLRRILRRDTAGESGAPPLAQISYFFAFYLNRALEHAGLGDLYLETLQPWRDMLAKGLSTTPEYPDPSRSDTHAWSAHPAYDLVTTIAGIRPASPGFSEVRIQPNLGSLEWVDASMPHPAGLIHVAFHRGKTGVNAAISLPKELRGVLVWQGKNYPLRGGEQSFALP